MTGPGERQCPLNCQVVTVVCGEALLPTLIPGAWPEDERREVTVVGLFCPDHTCEGLGAVWNRGTLRQVWAWQELGLRAAPQPVSSPQQWVLGCEKQRETVSAISA